MWQYEPKWDGFRCILSRQQQDVTLLSKAGQDLTRYFPELVTASLVLKPTAFTLDGEIVIPQGRSLSFDSLLQRIHPAASRIAKLAVETPACFVAFDILMVDNSRIAAEPLNVRRRRLQVFAHSFHRNPAFRLSPASANLADAQTWLKNAGGGFDGVIAKRTDLPYQSGTREGMQKIKRYRSADCVIGGMRFAKNQIEDRPVTGSLLLGLYDEAGELHHVGFSSAIKTSEKPALTERLLPLRADHSFTINVPGGPSRWSTRQSSEWIPLTPKLVVEVSYDHFTGGRFRHGTSILRWRPDKAPRQCTMDQLQQKTLDIRKLIGNARP